MITTIHHPLEQVETDAQRLSMVSWGAIFAGWLLGYAISMLMFNFGSAIGLSAIDMTNPESFTQGIAVGSAVYVLFTWAVSLFLGGLFASWLSGKGERMTGILHGMSVWALTLVFAIFIGITGITGAVKAGQSIGQGIISAGGAAAGQADQNQIGAGVLGGLQAQIKEQVGQTLTTTGGLSPAEARETLNRLDQNVLSSIAGDLARGNPDGARNSLITNTNLSRADVDRVLSGLSQQVEQAKTQFSEAARQAQNYSAAALWVIFFSGLIGLVAAGIGGAAGSRRLVKAYRRYEHAEH